MLAERRLLQSDPSPAVLAQADAGGENKAVPGQETDEGTQTVEKQSVRCVDHGRYLCHVRILHTVRPSGECLAKVYARVDQKVLKF